MHEEREDDRPDWEVEDEKIPPSLEKKWRAEEKEGLRAGVCRNCGYPFTKDDLSCRHCETSTDLNEGVFISLKRFFLGTPFGILSLVIIFLAIIFFLVNL